MGIPSFKLTIKNMLNINLIKTVSNYVKNKNLHIIAAYLPQSRIVDDDLYMEILHFKKYYPMSYHNIIKGDNFDALKWKYKYDIKRMKKIGYNIICEMSAMNKLRLIKWFERKIGFENESNIYMALHWASMYGHLKIIKWIFNGFVLNKKASIDNCVMSALDEGHLPVLKYFIEKQGYGVYNLVFLGKMIQHKNLNIVKYLFEYFKFTKGSLHFPIENYGFKSIEVLVYLLEKIPDLFDNIILGGFYYTSKSRKVLHYIFEHDLCRIALQPTYNNNDRDTLSSRLSITDNILETQNGGIASGATGQTFASGAMGATGQTFTISGQSNWSLPSGQIGSSSIQTGQTFTISGPTFANGNSSILIGSYIPTNPIGPVGPAGSSGASGFTGISSSTATSIQQPLRPKRHNKKKHHKRR